MKRQQIIDQLKNIVATSSQTPINTDTITGDTTIGELGFDSLSVLDLIYDIQQAFGMDFEIQELVNINSVDELAEFIEEEMKS